jgi:hypothetical protein
MGKIAGWLKTGELSFNGFNPCGYLLQDWTGITFSIQLYRDTTTHRPELDIVQHRLSQRLDWLRWGKGCCTMSGCGAMICEGTGG